MLTESHVVGADCAPQFGCRGQATAKSLLAASCDNTSSNICRERQHPQQPISDPLVHSIVLSGILLAPQWRHVAQSGQCRYDWTLGGPTQDIELQQWLCKLTLRLASYLGV